LSNDMKIGFEMDGVMLPIVDILPIKQIGKSVQKSPKYNCILASIKEVGIIEPPVVCPAKKDDNGRLKYLLLDGHIRIDILKHLGHTEVFCIVSTDDESYTFNDKVNRLSPIQEHFMIMKTIENGVGEDRIAKTLNANVKVIRKNRDLLNGICPEAVGLLKDKRIIPDAIRQLKKVKPMRQIEMAELMNAVSNYSTTYTKALIAATPKDMFVDNGQAKESTGIRPEDMKRMEKEMETLERDFKMIEETYGRNVLNLVLARGYLSKILDNARVVKFLSSRYGEILTELQKIVESLALEA
jgi:hypothetical protein